MATVTSPPSLQLLCEATASAWLVQWSGILGQVAAQAASSEAPTTCRGLPHASTQSSNSTKTNTAGQYFMRNNAHYSLEDTSNKTEEPYLKQGPSPKGNIKKLIKSCICRKMIRKINSKNAIVKYPYDRETFSNDVQDQKYDISLPNIELLEYGNVKLFGKSNSVILNQPSSQTTLQNQNLEILFPSRAVPYKLHDTTLKENVRKCAMYLKFNLPPLLIDQVVSSAWMNISEKVITRSYRKTVHNYDVANWARKAPVVLLIAANISERKFPLNISGVGEDIFDYTLNFIEKHFPLERINKLTLPRIKFKPCLEISKACIGILNGILQKTSLVSLVLDSIICDDSILSLLSQFPIQELNIGGNSVSEEGIIKGLAGMSQDSACGILKEIDSGEFWTHTLSPLRKSLCKLSISFQNISNLMYHMVPYIFPNLQYYDPGINMLHCVMSYGKTLKYYQTTNTPHPSTLQLARIKMGYASRAEMLEISKICLSVREISLTIDQDCEEVLEAIQSYKQLTHLELTFYPSFSSYTPKLDGRVLLPVIKNLKQQIQYLSLTGFNITGCVLHELSQLPELRTLKLLESWLSNPTACNHHPFPSLENLTLQYLPTNCIMQLLTGSSNLVNLSFNVVESDWVGNAITDDHIKYLVTSGMISSIQSFSVSSSSLTFTSLKTLSLLPFLRSISHVANWGLTDEELRFVTQSGLPHILYIY